MEFLSSALLSGIGLISVPIIIHILNRRKFKVVEWAPMKYLKLAIKTTRRRIRLEQLLLLLVRCLFIVALVMALARPAIRQGSALSWIAGSSKAARVLVIDDTLSMGTALGEGTSLDVARKAAAMLIAAMSKDDVVTVLRATAPEEPVLRETAVAQIDGLNQILEGVAQRASGTNWVSVLKAASRRLAVSPYPVKEITLLTDLRREGWSNEIRSVTSQLAADGATLRVVDVAAGVVRNVAMLALVQESGVAVPGIDTRFTMTVRNDGTEAFGPTNVTLRVGDVTRSVAIPRVESKETLEIPVSWNFLTPGIQGITLELPAQDDLRGDDTRYCSVDVRGSLDALLVDGDPADEAFESETDFLIVALTVGDVPWRVYGVTDSEWLSQPPPDADMTVLANVANLAPENVEPLEKLVRAGMGLMIFPGDQLDPGLMNSLLWREGEGLLPGRVMDVIEEPVEGLVIEKVAGSPLLALEALAPEALTGIRTARHLQVSVEGPGNGRVLARWDDTDRSPALIERRFGKGRVLLWTTTADRGWSEWPVDPTYLLAAREASLFASKRGVTDINFAAGQPLTMATRARVADGELFLRGADASEPLRAEEADGGWRLVHDPLERVGLHRTSWTNEDSQKVSRQISVSPVAEESDLTRLPPEELRDWANPLEISILHHSRLAEALKPPAKELWRTFLYGVLAFFVIESLLMVWVGRKG